MIQISHEEDPYMFKKILFPTDFSETASKAMKVIEQLKCTGAEEVVVVHIIDRRTLDALLKLETEASIRTNTNTVKEEKEQRIGQVESKMETVKKELESKGFTVKTRIEIDVPFLAILKAEKEEAVSVIVIGSHGLSNIEEMLLGSVSEKVIRKAKSPVIVVKR